MIITPNMVLGFTQQKGFAIVVKLPENTFLKVGDKVSIADKDYSLSYIQGINPNINSYALTLESESILSTLFQQNVANEYFKF